MDNIRNIIPGLLLTSLIAFLSFYISSFILIGSVAIAILLGIAINNTFLDRSHIFKIGISFSEKQLLGFAIILLGASLDFNSLNFVSIDKIFIILFVIFISIFLCYMIGKLFGVSTNLSLLLGIGNGICGSSAIAGASKIIDADKNDTGISIATINILGALSIFILPYILINFFSYLTDDEFGFIIGSTVQAVGQVTATGFMINSDVAESAILIKMIRIVMLGPLLLLLSFLPFNNIKNSNNKIFSIPSFIIGFIVMSLLVTLQLIPDNILLLLSQISKLCFVIAMAGIGLNISFRNIFKFGFKSIIVGFLAFTFQVISVLIFILIF